MAHLGPLARANVTLKRYVCSAAVCSVQCAVCRVLRVIHDPPRSSLRMTPAGDISSVTPHYLAPLWLTRVEGASVARHRKGYFTNNNIEAPTAGRTNGFIDFLFSS